MSQLDGETKTIGEDTYKVVFLDPMVATDLLVDLKDVLGPALGGISGALLKAENSKEALGHLMDGVKEAAEEEDEEDKEAAGAKVAGLVGDNIEQALVSSLDRLTSARLRRVIGLMTGVTSVQKGDAWPELAKVFPIHFRGRQKAMYLWLAFAVRVQFRDFF